METPSKKRGDAFPLCDGFPLSDLPKLVMDVIFQLLPIADFLSLGSCCGKLLAVSRNERLWSDLIKRDFGESVRKECREEYAFLWRNRHGKLWGWRYGFKKVWDLSSHGDLAGILWGGTRRKKKKKRASVVTKKRK